MPRKMLRRCLESEHEDEDMPEASEKSPVERIRSHHNTIDSYNALLKAANVKSLKEDKSADVKEAFMRAGIRSPN